MKQHKIHQNGLAERLSVRDFEMHIAVESKKNLKAFFSYAKSKLKTKWGVPDLVNKDGNIANTDSSKA